MAHLRVDVVRSRGNGIPAESNRRMEVVLYHSDGTRKIFNPISRLRDLLATGQDPAPLNRQGRQSSEHDEQL